jgi:hypothetical protein
VIEIDRLGEELGSAEFTGAALSLVAEKRETLTWGMGGISGLPDNMLTLLTRRLSASHFGNR